MRVIIAEKPSVAKNIADAFKVKKRCDGYFEGEEYLITWAFGHLLELYDAKDYDDKMKSWRLENFPFMPQEFKYKVKEDKTKKTTDLGAKKQLKCIKDLINRQDVEAVISATDYDREGQIIADIIFAYLKVKKPIYRLLLNEWTEKEVQKGIEQIVPNREMKPLQDAGISRQQADWLIGINLTSVATVKYGGRGELLNVGRVLLPTLKLIYDRDQEIEAFREEPYYKLAATFEKGELNYEGIYTEDKKDKFEEKSYLEEIKQKIEGKIGRITKKEKIEKTEYPQSLFNLSALQGYVTSKYQGFTSDKVLSIAQGLYEKKYITYPRTASSVLDESLVDKVRSVLFTLKKGLPFEDEIQFSVSKKVFNSKKVESHSAIIPTYVVPKNLSPQEEKVYYAIRNRFLAQFMPPAKIEETTIETTIEGTPFVFITKGKIQKELGFKKVEQEQSKEVILPSLEEGMQFEIEKLALAELKTKPPAPYTEKTLLRAMETCGKQFKASGDEEDKSEDEKEESEFMDAILSGFSIGTPATRAETLKKLNTTGYTVMQKKNIRCTPKGKYIIEMLPVKELMDLEYTGRLEKTLQDIEKGKVTKNDFLVHIKQFVASAIKDIKGQRARSLELSSSSTIAPASYRASKATSSAQVKSEERERLGKCPYCGGDVIEGKKGFGCLGYKTGCHFVLWKEIPDLQAYGKNLTKTAAKALLKKGEATFRNVKLPSGEKRDVLVKLVKEQENKEAKIVVNLL
ncbi:DNA topoisomerase III [Sporanaerobium hydrogeniformans]|uniref:DNA topoisomerase III n=1 Tax=Sporanaerobium hydrogeniformans TaxID=3072179 RepID=A0AC61DHL7_9FIRM|nr:DNA topoisomerase [Sporanaerobium hydrogeniformans]PHV72081.1 DNA topoisomerase III [Sporanaerobium hydrogeniformans]